MICKRVPQRLPTRPNDIYVCRNTRYVAMVTRAQKLLDSGWNEIYIHGLGAAISHAINLALQLKERGAGTISLDTHTDTVQLCDDFIPATEDGLPVTMVRYNSAVHIKVSKIDAAAAMIEALVV